jgi:trimethylamine--corrinoid protein Co-methyltransferase
MSERAVPTLTFLNEEQLDRVEEAALQILERVGIKVATEEARDLLASGGGLVDDEIVKIPRAMVREALESAPKRFTIYDREGEEVMRLGEGNKYFGTGVTSLYYLDPFTGERRDFTLDDFTTSAKLAQGLDNIDFTSTPGVVRPSDETPIELVNQMEFMRLVRNTTKPLMVLIANGPILKDIYEMAALVRGSREAFSEKPFVVPYLNPVSPLLFNVETLDKLLLAADRGVPAVCQGAPATGGSSPVTVAGSVAVGAAETLAGLVISQLRRPGTPYITGVVPFVMDMKSGNIASTGPDMLLWMLAAGELAQRWGIPAVGVGGGGDSLTHDEQSALEPAFFAQGVAMGGSDIVFDAGNIECGLIFSPRVAVFANEIYGMYRSFKRGLPWGDEDFSIDTTEKVGPAGFFLGEQETLDRFRELWSPDLLNWAPRTMWEERGSKTFGERAADRISQILEEHDVADLPAEVVAGMDAIIEATRATIPEEED